MTPVDRLRHFGAGFVPAPDRRRRRAWTDGHGKAHVEVRWIHRPGSEPLARAVEHALTSLDPVRWAQVNALAGRVVVAFDPDALGLDDLIDAVEDVERTFDVGGEAFPHDRPDHPADLEPARRQAIALGAGVVGLGVSLFGQALRITPLPGEVAAVMTMAENERHVREFLESRVGAAATDLGLGLANAAALALSHGPLGLTSAIVQRTALLSEARSRRALWRRREPELAGEPSEPPLPPLDQRARPVPLPDGPVERWSERAGVASVGVFGVGLAATHSPRRAASAFVAGLPRPAVQGRDAFAAMVGRGLAARGVLVMDPRALRRLDRIDTLVLDRAVARSGRLLLEDVEPGPAEHRDREEVARRILTMAPPAHLDREHHRGDWAESPVAGNGAARPTLVLELSHRGEVVGRAPAVAEADPLAAALVGAARRADLLVVAAGGRAGDAVLDSDRSVDGGRRLLGAVEDLQREGHGVLLVSGGDPAVQAALRAADCGVGVVAGDHDPSGKRSGPHPPWGAHLLTGEGLDGAWMVVEATAVARTVSRRSSALSAIGTGAGAIAALTGAPSASARRATAPVQAATLAAQAAATVSAAGLSRRTPPRVRTEPDWHAMSADEVMQGVDSSLLGLDPEEAARRLPSVSRRDGPPAPLRLGKAVLGELANPLTPILGIGSGLAAAVGSASDALLVGGVMATNAVVSGIERFRTEVSLERLFKVTAVQVVARRGGRSVEVDPDHLVRGDVVELEAGDVVPADCRILEAVGTEVDESVLTGESLPVIKRTDPVGAAAVAERHSMLYAGTTIVTGSALAVVVATGNDTESGRTLADAPEPPPSGVEARLAELTRVTVPATLASGAAVVGLGLLRGLPLRETVGSAVSLTVAAVPEGLPLLATAAQLAAAHRLAGRNALARNPRTIEALGRVDLLCFDKTGTLTAGRIGLQRVSDGTGDEPAEALGRREKAVLAAALRASPAHEDGDDELPHATDRAILEGAELVGVRVDDGTGGWNRVGELAFEPARGFHAAVGTGPDGSRVTVKGAPEVVLPRCGTWFAPDGSVTVDGAVRQRLDAEVERLAGRGLRVLAVAERSASAQPELDDQRVSNMELLGFVGLADHVRPTAADAVDRLRHAGVDVVMITGDHPSTAEAIAEELDILDSRRVLSGAELDALSDDQLTEVLPRVSVFARVTPAHKVRIVEAYQRAGRVVAMTGDGANDAPAIRLANAGIALGRRGTASARDAADLVVTDDRLETIIDAIVEGRAMWGSVRDALAILLGGNLGEVGFTLAGTALSGRSPLNARQLLLVNLLTDMLPALAIALRPPRHRSPEDLLHEGPEASLGPALVRQIGVRAAATAAGAGGAWMAARLTGRGRRASTVALVALVGTQLAQTALVGGTSPLVVASTVASGAVLVGIVQTPGVSQFFGCTPLGPVAWGIGGSASALATTSAVVVPRVVKAARRPRPDGSPLP